MPAMVDVTRNGTRLEQLRTLALVIAETIDSGDGDHSMAQLARQYRETVREIELLESEADDGDIVSRLMSESRDDRASRADEAGRA